jgi:hypothetical protein
MPSPELQAASRVTALEIITRKDVPYADDIRLLQVSLRDAGGFYKGGIDGAINAHTTKAVADFLHQPQNKNYAEALGDHFKNILRKALSNVTKIGDRPVKNPGMESMILQANAFKGYDIRRLQHALGIKEADGLYDQETQNRLIDYLFNNVEYFAVIGTPLLRLLLSTPDSAEALQQMPKPPEYYDRVARLIDAVEGMRNTNAQTYQLQVLLNAGGYYRNKNNAPFMAIMDGTPGEITERAIRVFEHQQMQKSPYIERKMPAHSTAEASLMPTYLPMAAGMGFRN